MKLVSLKTRGLPGFENQGLTISDLSPDLTVVLGANASGKTTLCRTIQGLLWAEHLKSAPEAEIYSLWSLDHHKLEIQASAFRLRFFLDGVQVDPIVLPPAYLAHSYVITLDDLFEDNAQSETHSAQQIAKEMTGGFDLAALRRSALVSWSPKSVSTAKGELRRTQADVRSVKREQATLAAEEARLPDLTAEYHEACRAEQRIKLLDAAQTYQKKKHALLLRQEEISAYPSEISLLLGNEIEVLAEARDARDRKHAQLKAAELKLNELDAARAKLHFKEESTAPTRLKNIMERLQRIFDEQQRLKQQIARCRGSLHDISKKISPEVSLETIPPLNADILTQIELLQRRFEEISQKQNLLKAEIQYCAKELSNDDPESLSQAAATLRRWLRAPDTRSYDFATLIRWIVLFSAVLLTVAVLTPTTGSNLLWMLAGLPVLIIIWVALPRSKHSQSNLRASLKEQFETILQDGPPDWEPKSVTSFLEQLEDRLLSAKAAAWAREKARRLEADLAVAQAEGEQLEVERKSLAAKVGVTAPTTLMGLSLLTSNLDQYQRLASEMRGLESALTDEEVRFASLLKDLNTALQSYGIPEAQSLDEAVAAVKLAGESAETACKLEDEIRLTRSTHEQLHQDLTLLQDKYSGLFSRLNLAESDENGLHKLCNARPAYLACAEDLKVLERECQTLEQELAQNAPELLELDQHQLAQQHLEFSALADRREALLQETTAIKTRISDARQGRKLETALKQQGRAQSKLAGMRDQIVLASAALFLLNQVESEYQLKNEPLVFKEAARLFEIFTRGAYKLVSAPPHEETPEFRAHDTALNRTLRLDQLSRGTRMQLQLAVRFAFAASAESGIKLPFLLDEALCISDPERFKAISEALIAITREGRQLIYFTSQPHEAALWQTLTEQHDVPKLKVLSLSKGDPARSSLTLVPTGTHPPEPNGLTLEEYVALLKPARIVPANGGDAVPIAHLADDPQLIWKLLSAGITTFGQLKTLFKRGSFSAFLDQTTYEKIKARAEVVDAFHEAYQIGRGRPLTEGVLEAAGLSGRIL
ncbi:MAG: AAA family ATPase [Deltaproteobacteria bacterium]|nr:AAA family ATPase [Deltaproteobacteria bacterium]